jgi:PAS domain S-box-containing protein
MKVVRRPRIAYAAAVGGPPVIALGWLVFGELFGESSPLVCLLLPVVAASCLAGLRPGLVATLLGAACGLGLMLDATSALPPGGAAQLAAFAIVGAMVSCLTEALHRSHARTAASESELRVTLASIGDAVIVADTRGRVAFMNPVAERLTGWAIADAAGRPLGQVFRVVAEDTRKPCEDPVGKVIATGRVAGLANHALLVARDGGEIAIEDSAAPIGGAGPVLGVVLVFRDVSGRRRLERDRENMTRLLHGTRIFIRRLDGRIVAWTEGVVRMYGWSAEEAIGRVSHELLKTEFPEPLRDIEAALLRDGSWEGELAHRHKNGTPLRVASHWLLHRDLDGEPQSVLEVNNDITALRRAERDLREAERRYGAVVDQIRDYAIFMLDTDGRVTSWNEGVKRVLGFDEHEFVGRNVANVTFTPEEAQSGVPQCVLREAAETGSARHDRWAVRKDGTRYYASGVTSALRDDCGKLLGFVKVMHDETEKVRLDSDLRRQQELLRDADRRKDEFLATLAHELRNPLAPMRNALEILKHQSASGAHLQWARDVMDRQVIQMARLLDDLLDVSRITRDKLELRKERILLSTVLNGAVETARPLIEHLGHELSVELPPEPIYLDADIVRLAQVFSNLLNNAARYTDRGGRIRLTAWRENGHAVVAVKDNGIGIPPDQLKDLFEIFTQLHRSFDRSRSGLGIGLTLVRRLVELHGGTVGAQSEGPGKGSAFTVRLPVYARHSERAPQLQAPARLPTAAHRRKIVIADDSDDSKDSLATMLKIMGHEVKCASDGLEAVEAASTHRPDVVLLDIGMPRMNGYDAARRIRAQPWGRDMVLVALTGWGQEADRRLAQEAGFDHHLLKPADVSLLEDILDEAHA